MKTLSLNDTEMTARDFIFHCRRGKEDIRLQGKPWREVARDYVECKVKSPLGWCVTITYLGGSLHNGSFLIE